MELNLFGVTRRTQAVREARYHLNRALIEKLPRLKLIAQTGRVGAHIDVEACTRLGIAVSEGGGSPSHSPWPWPWPTSWRP